MKRTIGIVLAALLAVLVLAACGDKPTSSTAPGSSVPAPAPSSSAPGSTPASAGGSSVVTGTHDVNAVLEALSTAANLGGTIKVTETDLKLGGVEVENIAEFAGAESQLSAENGGIVVVIHAKEGTADTVATQLGAFRDSRMGNADYAEFENARANTAEARIKVFGNYVVYAVSATGHEGGWDALDAAIDAAFA